MTQGITMGNAFGVYVVKVTFDPASVATITTAEQAVTVPGAKVGDMVFVNKPTLTAGLGLAGARVSAANTVYITFVNPTAGSIDAGSEVYTFTLVRPSGAVAATSAGD